jgi:hypothetical protein
MDQPRTRVVGEPLLRPLRRRGKKRFLNGVLCGSKVTKAADNCTNNDRSEISQQRFDARIDRSHATIVEWRPVV